MQKIALAMVMMLAAGCAQMGSQTPAPPQQTTTTLRVEPAAQADPTPAPLPAAAPLPRIPRIPVPPLASAAAESVPAVKEPEAAPELPVDIWMRLSAGFAMPDMDNELVRQWEQWYSDRPDYVARMIDRSRHFLFYIVEQVEKRNMPTEIALLPMIESAYNPEAYSKAHASGLWQFIPSTGRHYGLRQNYWYDGRRDVIEATEAALDYLEKLYDMFGDWQLALASYNWGEGAVSRAIERNRAKGLPTDYVSLTLPAETRSYVPKLVAVKNIISHPARFGLEIEDIPNEPYFDVVKVKQHIDVELAAELAELPLDEFKFLNPGHKKPVIKAGEAEQIVLPKNKVSTFHANLKTHDKPLVSWKIVHLRRAGNTPRLARTHGMTVAELKRAKRKGRHKHVVRLEPVLVRVRSGVEDPELPDLAAAPVSLPRAFKAAKVKAAKVKTPVRRGQRVQVRGAKIASSARQSARKHGNRPVKQLRTSRSTPTRLAAPGNVRASAKARKSAKRHPLPRR